VGKKSTESVAASSPTGRRWKASRGRACSSSCSGFWKKRWTACSGGAVRAAATVSMPIPGYRNGFGQPRRLSLSNGTFTLRRRGARAE